MGHLADLLGHDHPLFAYNLAQLEQATAGAGVDTRLYADCTQKAHDVMRRLGLDPADTLASELYQALNAAVRRGEAERELADTGYVLLDIDGEIVSFNLQDVIENSHHELHVTDRSLEHARRHLRAEIVHRYAEHDKTDHELVHKLADEAGLKPERDEGHVPLEVDKDSLGKRPTIYAVGDIFSDVFIQLSEEDSAVDEAKDGEKWLKIPFGSKPPYIDAQTVDAVGPSPNAGVACARLGVDVSLLAWMGDDEVAQQTRRYLDDENIDHQNITSKHGEKSNVYYVLRRGAERTILVKNQHYDYKWLAPSKAPDWIYLSLISDDSWPLHADLLQYLADNESVKFAFQPGTFHFRWGVDKCRPLYERAEVVILNREEAVEITGGDHADIPSLARKLHEIGPHHVVITDGKDGSYVSYDDTFAFMPNYPDKTEPVDRTGAGDAFASTIVAALALGEDIETALSWAPINSMNVVSKLGAQAGLQTKAQIETWLQKAPKTYALEKR